MPDDPDFAKEPAQSIDWYRCKNPACRRWLNIWLMLGSEGPQNKESETAQMNLHMMFCPMCGHKHGK
jgi:hypothetical protein